MTESTLQSRVDSLFEAYRQPGSPGCALGVMVDGQLVYSQGYGLANLEYDIPITPRTVFHVASMSKQFAAMAVALLAHEGRLSLDDDIRTYLPEVPDFGATIAIRHLIHHTSGLRDDVILLIAAGWRLEDLIAHNDVFELMARQQGLNFAPGAKFSYCGVGYMLLASLVERVSGKSLNDYCHERIFGPLGMESTFFHDDPLHLTKNRAYAYYEIAPGEYKNAILTCSLVGGTGLFTTIEDLARWEANFHHGTVGGAAVLEQMTQRGVLNNGETIDYAFGLIHGKHKGLDTLSHGGDGAGIHGYMARIPEEKFSVVVLGNCSSIRAAQLAWEVADLYLVDKLQEETTAEKTEIEAMDVPLDLLESRAGRYFDRESAAFIDLAMNDGKLTLYGYDLAAKTETDFFFAADPSATALFTPETETAAMRVKVDIGLGPSEYEKIEPVSPTSEKLRAYVGRYESSELEVVWTVTLENDALQVARKRQGTSTLAPLTTDIFTDGWMGPILHGGAVCVLTFVRDGSGRVTGMTFSDAGGRARNIVFRKLTDEA